MNVVHSGRRGVIMASNKATDLGWFLKLRMAEVKDSFGKGA
jgi:hypothetical protein